MARYMLLAFIVIVLIMAGAVFGQENDYGFGHSWQNNNDTYMRPYKHDAYGPGLHSDATGRPFQWKTQDGQTSLGEVKPNGYGLGVGMDNYGRPVKPSPWPNR